VSKKAHVEPTEAPEIPLPRDFDEDVVVLPREVDENGRGLYDDSALTIVKEFRAAGVTARYQHGQDNRTWIGEKSATALMVNFLIGISSNAGWDALCWLLRRRHSNDQVRVRVGRVRKTHDGLSWEWYSAKGSGAAVAAALAAIERPQRDDGSHEQEAPTEIEA